MPVQKWFYELSAPLVPSPSHYKVKRNSKYWKPFPTVNSFSPCIPIFFFKSLNTNGFYETRDPSLQLHNIHYLHFFLESNALVKNTWS